MVFCVNGFERVSAGSLVQVRVKGVPVPCEEEAPEDSVASSQATAAGVVFDPNSDSGFSITVVGEDGKIARKHITSARVAEIALDFEREKKSITDPSAAAAAAAERLFRTEERVGSETFTAGENVLGRDFARAEGRLSRDFSREELAAEQRFSADQSRLGRGLSAAAAFSGAEGDRATISLRASEAEANRRRGLVQDASANAMQLAQLISMTDPAAQLAFQEAGGGVISNAIASGANALSRGALLPGARTLRASDNIAALLAEPLSYERQRDFDPRKFLDPFTASEIYQPVLDGVPGVATDTTPGSVDGDTGVVATPDGGPVDVAAAPPTPAPRPNFVLPFSEGGKGIGPSFRGEDLPRLLENLGEVGPGGGFIGLRGTGGSGVAGGVGAAAMAAPRILSDAAARRSLENPADVGLMDWQDVVSAAEGFTGRVTRPTTFVVAENGPEDVNITPVGQVRSQLPRTFGNEAIGGNVGDDEYMRRIRAIREGVEVQEPLGLNPFSTRFSKIAPSLRDRFFAARKTKFGIPLADQINEERQYRLRGVQRGAVQGV